MGREETELPRNRNGVVTTEAPFPGMQQPEAPSPLREGIRKLLSGWTGLQLAVQNQWGGRDSLMKSDRLSSDILSLFSHPKATICIEDLECLLHECLLFSFNTEIEDGSIEEVAEQLMMLHEECSTSPDWEASSTQI